jgi:hypothetical protein
MFGTALEIRGPLPDNPRFESGGVSMRRRPRSLASQIRDFVNFDVSITRAALRHLGPEVQALLCAPALAILALLDHFFPGA